MSKTSSISLYLFLKDITLDGGCERVVVNMANEFSKLYQNVHIVSNFQSNDKIKYEIDESVKIHFVHPCLSLEKWKSNHSLKFLFKSGIFYKILLSIGFTTHLYQYITKNRTKVDTPIVLFHGYDTAWYKKKNIKLIGVDHSSFPFYKSNSFFYRKIKFPIISFMNRKLDIVTILSNSEIEYWKLLKRPTYIIHNFIPDIPVSIPNFQTREKIILSIGRMNTNQKGFDKLIKAYSKIASKYPDWKLHIFGSGVLKSEYQDLITSLKMDNFIKLFEFTSNPSKEYYKSSLYAMCSRSEGFPMVLLEAMSCGLPVVSYDLSYGPAVIIKDGYSGLIVPDNDEALFCDKMEYLINNPEISNSMSINSHIDVTKRFSKNVIIGEWIKLFELLCNKTN
jgi:glycosyltransferase involved in cell wall biosynthesis